MQHLKLVVNTDFSIQKIANTPVDIQRLSPTRNESRRVDDSIQTKSISYGSLIIVFVAHALAFLWLISVKPSPPILKEPAVPMLVSLVTNPAPEPELVPVIPKPIVQQQKLILKKKVVEKTLKPTPIISELAVEQPIQFEALPPTAVGVVAKMPEVVEPPAPKAEPAPVIEPPRFGAAYLNNPAPDYPSLSRRLGEEGRVLLRVLVTEKGLAETVEIEKTSGSTKLDQAAIQAVKKWSFIPAKKSNQPMSAYVLVPVKFSLES